MRSVIAIGATGLLAIALVVTILATGCEREPVVNIATPTTLPGNAATRYREAIAALPAVPPRALHNADYVLTEEELRALAECQAAVQIAGDAGRMVECDWNLAGRNSFDFAGRSQELDRLRSLGGALVLQARQQLKRDAFSEAVVTLDDSFKLARRLQAVKGLSYRLTGIGIESQALTTAGHFAVNAPKGHLREIRRRIEALPPATPLRDVIAALSPEMRQGIRDQEIANGTDPGRVDAVMKGPLKTLDDMTAAFIDCIDLPLDQHDAAVARISAGTTDVFALRSILESWQRCRHTDLHLAVERAQFRAGSELVLGGQQAFDAAVDPLTGGPFTLRRPSPEPNTFAIKSARKLDDEVIQMFFYKTEK